MSTRKTVEESVKKILKEKKEKCHWIRHDDELQQLIFKRIQDWKDRGRQWSGTYFTDSIFRTIARIIEEERKDAVKTFTSQIEEVINTLYGFNSQIVSLKWIGMNRTPTKDEIIDSNKLIGEQIKKLRDVIE